MLLSFGDKRAKPEALSGDCGSGRRVRKWQDCIFAVSSASLGQPRRIRGGRVLWQGRDLLELGEHDMPRVRGSEIAMIFQNPQASLNPVPTIGSQVASVIRSHQKCDSATARQEALRWLEAVRISEPLRVCEAFPHQCSGGMCQRIPIAMTLSAAVATSREYGASPQPEEKGLHPLELTLLVLGQCNPTSKASHPSSR